MIRQAISSITSKAMLVSMQLCIILTGNGCTDVSPDFEKEPPGTRKAGSCDKYTTTGECPSWYKNMPVGTWYALDFNTLQDVDPASDPINPAVCSYNSDGTPDINTTCVVGQYRTKVHAWNGAIARENFLSLVAQGGGGSSSNSGDNGVYEFGPFTDEVPKWQRSYEPSRFNLTDWELNQNQAYYIDGKPAARHGYEHQTFIPPLSDSNMGNRWFAPWGAQVYSSSTGAGTRKVASFQFNKALTPGGEYDPEETFPDYPNGSNNSFNGAGGFVLWDSKAELVWTAKPRTPRILFSMDPRTRTWEGGFSADIPFNNYTASEIDPERRIIIVHYVYSQDDGSGNFINIGKLYVIDISLDERKGKWVQVPMSGDLADDEKLGIEYEPIGKTFVAWRAEKSIYTLRPPSNYRNPDGSLNQAAQWNWIRIEGRPEGATPTTRETTGTYGRFQYIESLHALALLNSYDGPVYVYKLPPAGL